MTPFSQEVFVSMLALTGAVIVVSALLSGLVERSGLPQVAVFLALGALIGPAGLALFDAGVNSPILRVVATLSLVLVLFTDAVSLDIPMCGSTACSQLSCSGLERWHLLF